METRTCPAHLVIRGRSFNFAGAGRAPGAFAYVNGMTGEVVETFFVQVVSLGAAPLGIVANNAALPPVRVDHALLNGSGPLTLGQIVLVVIAFESSGPRATAAWTMPVKPPPVATERIGTIKTVVNGAYGFIAVAGGADHFFHVSELKGLLPVEGLPVRFIPRDDPRGPQATNVRPA